jgi:tetratricopeptide (TPR) repeat protein
MALDLLEFESEDLYFDEPLNAEVKKNLETAAEAYAYDEEYAEISLMRAYFLEPEHPMVLVALYRYYYYQHRLADALLVADRVLQVFAKRLELPENWRELNEDWIGGGVLISMTLLRFYMLALKGAGYIELRLGEYESAIARLKKVVELDANDRLGAQALLNIAHNALDDWKSGSVMRAG